ncbi:tetratricopeptide repeat protein [Dokdonella sp.]|uniref:tetratricopeptide repeat protein n=1 Tax=Dokdonella sp. TaxID=2291710 RepID=UPI003528AEEB
MSLFAELKRRNVIRMAGLYLVGAWLIVQVAETLLPLYETPDWVLKTLVLLLAIGFVPALIFAWIFELTPEGIKRDAEVVPDRSLGGNSQETSLPNYTARRMDRSIIVVLAVALIFFCVDKFVLQRTPTSASGQQPATASTDSKGAESESGASNSPSLSSKKSIAVLPFSDLSPGHDQEYFSDGMSEEILNALAQVKDLKVAGRTSSFFFKGKNENLRDIGNALGVANVLEGSVRKQGDQVRITAQLIQTSDGFHLWSESYDGNLANVFELQERIARAITDELKVVLDAGQQERLARQTTSNADAHQLYLRGRYFWSRRSYRNLEIAEESFKQALVDDPDYADAWAALAQTYALLFEYSINDPESPGRRDTSAEALDAAEHALRLNPQSSAALSARAVVRFQYRYDWKAAEEDFRAAVASNPADSTALQWYGEFLFLQRRGEEAGMQLDAALAVDPLAPIIHVAKANSLAYQGRTDAAVLQYDEALRLFPTMYVALKNKCFALIEQRRFDEAAALIDRLPGDSAEVMRLLIAAMQDDTLADNAVERILETGPGGVGGKPRMLMFLGRKELAMTELEKLFAAHDPLNVYLYAVPEFEPLWQEPRFQALLHQIGLSAAESAP